jgi:hypothetical protein
MRTIIVYATSQKDRHENFLLFISPAIAACRFG